MSEITEPTHDFSFRFLIGQSKKFCRIGIPLLVDRIVDLAPGQSIHAYKNVTANGEYQRIFHTAVMPGVLQLEAMAQAAALLVFYSTIQDAAAIVY